jgi:hypothetical protein
MDKNIAQKIRDELYKNPPRNYSFSQIVKLGSEKPLPFHIEKKRGDVMRWNETEPSPFDYGDFPNFINPADNMGWDIMIAPSSSPNDRNLLISGVVTISDDAENIAPPHGNKKGNHKLILSKDGVLSNEDKQAFNKYFEPNKSFNQPSYFDEKDISSVLSEDWEKATLQKFKLGKFKDESSKGIVVGPTARTIYHANKFKNNLPKTP